MHSFIYRKKKQKRSRICSQAAEGLSAVLLVFSAVVLLLTPLCGFLVPLKHFTLEIEVNNFFEHAVDSIYIIERVVCYVMKVWRCIKTGETFVLISKFLNFPTCREGLTLGGGILFPVIDDQ